MLFGNRRPWNLTARRHDSGLSGPGANDWKPRSSCHRPGGDVAHDQAQYRQCPTASISGVMPQRGNSRRRSGLQCRRRGRLDDTGYDDLLVGAPTVTQPFHPWAAAPAAVYLVFGSQTVVESDDVQTGSTDQWSLQPTRPTIAWATWARSARLRDTNQPRHRGHARFSVPRHQIRHSSTAHLGCIGRSAGSSTSSGVNGILIGAPRRQLEQSIGSGRLSHLRQLHAVSRPDGQSRHPNLYPGSEHHHVRNNSALSLPGQLGLLGRRRVQHPGRRRERRHPGCAQRDGRADHYHEPRPHRHGRGLHDFDGLPPRAPRHGRRFDSGKAGPQP